jgi:hypothetical protein
MTGSRRRVRQIGCQGPPLQRHPRFRIDRRRAVARSPLAERRYAAEAIPGWFYAEAGASEGPLRIDGQLLGWLQALQRP